MKVFISLVGILGFASNSVCMEMDGNSMVSLLVDGQEQQERILERRQLVSLFSTFKKSLEQHHSNEVIAPGINVRGWELAKEVFTEQRGGQDVRYAIANAATIPGKVRHTTLEESIMLSHAMYLLKPQFLEHEEKVIQKVLHQKVTRQIREGDDHVIDIVDTQRDRISEELKKKIIDTLVIKKIPRLFEWRVTMWEGVSKAQESSLEGLFLGAGRDNSVGVIDENSVMTPLIKNYCWCPRELNMISGNDISFLYKTIFSANSCGILEKNGFVEVLDVKAYGLINDVQLSPNKNRLALRCDNGVILIDRDELEPKIFLAQDFGSNWPDFFFKWSPDSSKGIVFGEFGYAFLDYTHGVITKNNTLARSCVEWSSDGSMCAIAGKEGVMIMDFNTVQITAAISTNVLNIGDIATLQWSADGQLCAVVGKGGVCIVSKYGKIGIMGINEVKGKGDFLTLKWFENHALAAYERGVICFGAREVKFIDASIFQPGYTVRWSPDNSCIALKYKEEGIKLIHHDGILQDIPITDLGCGSIREAMWSGDSKYLAVVCHGGVVILPKEGTINGMKVYKNLGLPDVLWSLNSQVLACAYQVSTFDSIMFINVEDGSTRHIALNTLNWLHRLVSLGWSDDGTVLACHYYTAIVLIDHTGNKHVMTAKDFGAESFESLAWSNHYHCFVACCKQKSYFEAPLNKVVFINTDGTFKIVESGKFGCEQSKSGFLLKDFYRSGGIIAPHAPQYLQNSSLSEIIALVKRH